MQKSAYKKINAPAMRNTFDLDGSNSGEKLV